MKTIEISDMLSYLKDDPRDVMKAVAFLYDLQAQKGPTAEIITILKHERPLLHKLLKQNFANNIIFNMLFELSLDYEQTKANLVNSHSMG